MSCSRASVRGFEAQYPLASLRAICRGREVVVLERRPVHHIVQVLGLPLTCLTLGLFALVINAAMLALTVRRFSLISVSETISATMKLQKISRTGAITDDEPNKPDGLPQFRPRQQAAI